MKHIIVFFFALSLISCGSPASHKKLNGTWTNPLVTITYDFDKGVTEITALGSTEKKKLVLVKDGGPTIVFKSGDEEITAQFQDDNTIILSKKGGIPLTMTRKK